MRMRVCVRVRAIRTYTVRERVHMYTGILFAYVHAYCTPAAQL